MVALVVATRFAWVAPSVGRWFSLNLFEVRGTLMPLPPSEAPLTINPPLHSPGAAMLTPFATYITGLPGPPTLRLAPDRRGPLGGALAPLPCHVATLTRGRCCLGASPLRNPLRSRYHIDSFLPSPPAPCGRGAL
jgi:hypothetical protein